MSLGVNEFEDVYQPELNPNLAVEWGWMRGMGKRVLYLQEQGFQYRRADWIKSAASSSRRDTARPASSRETAALTLRSCEGTVK